MVSCNKEPAINAEYFKGQWSVVSVMQTSKIDGEPIPDFYDKWNPEIACFSIEKTGENYSVKEIGSNGLLFLYTMQGNTIFLLNNKTYWGHNEYQVVSLTPGKMVWKGDSFNNNYFGPDYMLHYQELHTEIIFQKVQ